MKYLIGTSGYSYEDWREVFYPPGLPKGKMMDFYLQHFKTLEINSTYYRIPHPMVFYHIDRKTPPDFQLIAKVHQETTHVRKENAAAMRKLLQVLEPIRQNRKLAGLLAQFPYSFKNTELNRRYLLAVKNSSENIPVFFEFRNWTWERDEVFRFFQENELNFVNVDQPRLKGLMNPASIVTANLGYVRFHGRNLQNWWKGSNQTRYDYLYQKFELEEWLIRISRILKKSLKTYIFFNNHPQGKAIQNAKMLDKLLNDHLKSGE